MPNTWDELEFKKSLAHDCYCCAGKIGSTCDCNRVVGQACFNLECGKCKTHCKCGHYKPYINSFAYKTIWNKINKKEYR